jgi:site-specific DNA-methyltransferase (adenine-specific)
MTDYINITCEDNMELMARYPDNHFDLAIVDPPYGIGAGNMNLGKWSGSKLKKKEWDNLPPSPEYFESLFRVSRNQIIWGGNYFSLPPSRGFIVWHKGAGFRGRSFSECEFAFNSIDGPSRVFELDPLANGDYKGRIHKTQKPVSLYQWLLTNYAKPGDKILDTHIGSGSIAIAVDSVNKVEKMNLTLTGCELDPEYYEKAMERIKDKTAWQCLF